MINVETIMEQICVLWTQAAGIWNAGGWCMPFLAAVAMVMFTLGMNMHVKLGEKGFLSVKERTWRRWINEPGERKGPIGALLDFVTGGESLKDMSLFFKELQITEISGFSRDLKIMKICVGAAPLVGLLGTVTGMLSTFAALAHGGGGDQTMGLVASGISEALITTETGLVIALPGLFFQYSLARRHERYKAFLAHLETVCMQEMYKRISRETARQQPAQQQPAEGQYVSEPMSGRVKAALLPVVEAGYAFSMAEGEPSGTTA
jgi:biopolymer transport protein ExbB